jgi:hypothetical protein
MHVAIIKDDLKQLFHLHPSSHQQSLEIIKTAFAHGTEEADDEIMNSDLPFSVTFPETGLYKIFAQFRPQELNADLDSFLVVSFWIDVTDQPPLNELFTSLPSVSKKLF